MKAFSQNSSYDIFIDGNGQFAISSGLEAYKYIIEDAVRTQKGEKQLDVELGVPYFDTAFSDRTQLLLWKDSVKSVVMSYDFVRSISAFDASIDYAARTIKYTMTITTDIGDITITS